MSLITHAFKINQWWLHYNGDYSIELNNHFHCVMYVNCWRLPRKRLELLEYCYLWWCCVKNEHFRNICRYRRNTMCTVNVSHCSQDCWSGSCALCLRFPHRPKNALILKIKCLANLTFSSLRFTKLFLDIHRRRSY